jgi:hypothetical protein
MEVEGWLVGEEERYVGIRGKNKLSWERGS